MYSQTTNSLKVSVTPRYQEDLSIPSDNYYVWSYSIIIENYGTETMQLMNRFWKIIDANGEINQIEGPGVVGQQPILRPGEAFEYTSHAQLKTTSGIMQGSYEMVNKKGQATTIAIPIFSMDSPHEIFKIN